MCPTDTNTTAGGHNGKAWEKPDNSQQFTIASSPSELPDMPNTNHIIAGTNVEFEITTSRKLPCVQKGFYLLPTPDKGAAWLVLVFLFFGNFLTGGVPWGTYGTITVAQQTEFNISLAESSLAPTLNIAVRSFNAPLSSILVRKISCRTAYTLGGTLLVLGYGGCAFATQMWHIYILYGVIGGFGYALSSVSLIATIPHHFHRYKEIAMSTVGMGFVAGTIVVPVLSEALFSTYRYSTTMGIIGLCETIQIIIGLFFTETPKKRQNTDPNSNNTVPPQPLGVKSKDVDTNMAMDTNHANADETTRLLGRSADQSNVEDRQDITDVSTNASSVTAIKLVCSDWKVWCVNMSYALHDIPFQGIKLFAIQYVVKYCGLNAAEGALGLSIGGGTGLIGTVLLLSTSKLEFPRIYLLFMAPALQGCCVAAIALINGKVMYYSITFAWGITRAVVATTMLSVALKLRGPEFFHIIFGFNYFAQGFATLVNGPIFSYLQTDVDQTAGLYYCGAAGILSTLALLPVVVHRMKSATHHTSSL